MSRWRRLAPTAAPSPGNLAAGFEFPDDKSSFTLHQRQGTKWSDGHAFTTDDFVFMFADMRRNQDHPSQRSMRVEFPRVVRAQYRALPSCSTQLRYDNLVVTLANPT